MIAAFLQDAERKAFNRRDRGELPRRAQREAFNREVRKEVAKYAKEKQAFWSGAELRLFRWVLLQFFVLRLHVIGDLLQSREPHSGLRFHINNQFLKSCNP